MAQRQRWIGQIGWQSWISGRQGVYRSDQGVRRIELHQRNSSSYTSIVSQWSSSYFDTWNQEAPSSFEETSGMIHRACIRSWHARVRLDKCQRVRHTLASQSIGRLGWNCLLRDQRQTSQTHLQLLLQTLLEFDKGIAAAMSGRRSSSKPKVLLFARTLLQRSLSSGNVRIPRRLRGQYRHWCDGISSCFQGATFAHPRCLWISS